MANSILASFSDVRLNPIFKRWSFDRPIVTNKLELTTHEFRRFLLLTLSFRFLTTRSMPSTKKKPFLYFSKGSIFISKFWSELTDQYSKKLELDIFETANAIDLLEGLSLQKIWVFSIGQGKSFKAIINWNVSEYYLEQIGSLWKNDSTRKPPFSTECNITVWETLQFEPDIRPSRS